LLLLTKKIEGDWREGG